MKTLRLFLTSIFMLCCSAIYAYSFEVDGIYYDISSSTYKTVSVTYLYSEASINSSTYLGDILIPESVIYNGVIYKVTSIGPYAFSGCKFLTSIIIPNSVTSIGSSAFSGCDGLTNIVIPNSVTSIGSSAFSRCDGLTNIVIPNSVTSISSYAFYYCSSLNSLTIQNGVTSIGNFAFCGCKDLISIDIPKSVNSIGYGAFDGCGLVKIVVDENNLTYNSRENSNAIIETTTNMLHTGCTTTVIPNSVTSIGEYAFAGTDLTSIVIPNSVTSIGECAFQSCANLTFIEMPNSVQIIGKYAFRSCTGLINIIIPNGVTSIKQSSFDNCTSLTNIVIPNSVTSIGSSAFEDCISLTSIEIPHSVTYIDASAFRGCKNLKKVFNRSSLTFSKGSEFFGYIAYYADLVVNNYDGQLGNFIFSKENDTYNLYEYLGNDTELVLPESYKDNNYTIRSSVFKGCGYLTSIVIPYSVTNIGDDAFSGCYNLDRIYLMSEVPFAYNSSASISDNKRAIIVPESAVETYQQAEGWSTVAKYITSEERMTKSVEVTANNSGSAVRSAITDALVEGVVNLTIKGTINSYDIIVLNKKMPILHNLDLSEASFVACDYPYYKDDYKNSYCTADGTLSDYLFYDHPSLRSIKLPKEMKGTIARYAFYSCNNLQSVTLPLGLTSIESSAFRGCNALTSINFPLDLTSIGDYAFCNCSVLKNLDLPVGLKRIGNNAFSYTTALNNVILPPNLTTIGTYAFEKSGLTSVKLSPNLTSIGIYAFRGTKLSEIRIPSSLKSIETGAFEDVSTLKKVYIYTILPLTISESTFPYAASSELYIPETSSENYYFASGWNKFPSHTTFNEPYEYFYLNGDKVLNDNTGYIEGKGENYPNADIIVGGGIIVEGKQEDGETPNQSLGDVNLENDGNGNSGSIIGDNNLTVDNLNININVTSGKWYFFAFPFDIMLEDISLSNGGSYVWRYYDGAERANGKTGWKTVNGNKLNAAQGYIFQCSKSGVLTLNIENVRFKKEDKYLELLAHVSANLKDASWNFMGNPYLSYYDMSEMNYTAPVTVWDGSKYVAMRPGDDEYHFAPFQTFFVQKSEGTASVGFQGDKQMTQKQSQNKKAQAAAAPKMQVMSESEEQPARQLINLVLTSGEQTDGTRIVFNEAQSRAYEAACDAAKFETQGVIQLFTIGDQQERYAINERPADNGIVALGFSTPTAGDFTISAARMDTPVYLKDRETGSVYDLRQGAYQFSAGAGTHANRFEVLLEATVTGIEQVGTATEGDATKVYDLGGRRVKENGKGVYIINGEKTLVK